jgi:sigma-B regulation protein RsbU (phosphoserine phosphatase)
MPAQAPVVDRYRQLLDELRREGADARLLAPFSELVGLLELSTTLETGLPPDDALAAALLLAMRELRVERGAVFLRREDGAFEARLTRGLPGGMPPLGASAVPPYAIAPPADDPRAHGGLALLLPVLRRGEPAAALALGPLPAGRAYGEAERAFLASVAACAAAALESGLVRDELRGANRQLAAKVFQLHNLFDISRELTSGFEEEAVHALVTTTVMGHFLVSRAALYLMRPDGLDAVHERGVRREGAAAPIPAEEARAALAGLTRAQLVSELPEGAVRRRLESTRMALVAPLASGARVEGLLAVGERASRTPFAEEDREFAQTLGRQAFAALEGARLNRLRLEKQRQDQELKLAREIQRSLLPAAPPQLQNFELAGASLSCYEVGGDVYDWIELGDGRCALLVADVSGKGTPASLLMASVHAYVQALAGTAPPERVVTRLNRFLHANTQSGRFVTFFYGELETASRRMSYVNAGHVPPYRVSRAGAVSRLGTGGPALGLIAEADFEVGLVQLEPGDTLAMVTDGVTEATTLDDREFGDEQVCEVLRRLSASPAPAILEGLVGSAIAWAGAAGCGDDLTALILKAR